MTNEEVQLKFGRECIGKDLKMVKLHLEKRRKEKV